MLKSNIIIALRSLAKNKLYSAINIFGLAFSLALGFFVISHISYEYSFEDFQVNKDNIYRLEAEFQQEDHQYKTALLPYNFGKSIASELPELQTVSIFRESSVTSVQVDNERFRVIDPYPHAMHSHGNKLFFADAEYFNVFTFSLAQGNPKTALIEPFALIISEKAANDYFPGENPIGRTITINDRYDCHITGILNNTPFNTQLHTDFIMSYSTLDRFPESQEPGYYRSGKDLIYLLFKDDIDVTAVTSKIESMKNEFFTADDAESYSFYLMTLSDLMFRGFPGAVGDLNPRAEPSLIVGFILMAAFIILMAIANFVNLATAQSAERMKEVGVRKVFGAKRAHLMRQFLGESVILTVISSLLGLSIYEFIKVFIDSITTRPMLIDFYNNGMMLAGIIGLIILVGLAAGFYPALYLSRFKPIAVLQSKSKIKSSKSILRKSLVIFQFAITTVFVFLTLVVYRQTNMITSVDIGFETDNVMMIEFDGPSATNNCQRVRSEVLKDVSILAATAADAPPGTDKVYSHRLYKDQERLDENAVLAKVIDVDYTFAEMYGLELVEGRLFTTDHPEDIRRGLIINESARKFLEVENLLGYKFYRKDSFLEVIGVVKDFHGGALNYSYRDINILRLDPDRCDILMMKLPADNISGTIADIETIYDKALPSEQFAYSFLDEEIAKNFESLRDENKMFLYLCFVSIGITCLGIFGLVSFTAQQRSKEIGIRKVMGASVRNIVLMLSKEFLLLIAIASLIAWPIAYLLTKDFLQYFPFKVSIGIGTFLDTGFFTVLVALMSAGFKAYRAALSNPADILKYE